MSQSDVSSYVWKGLCQLIDRSYLLCPIMIVSLLFFIQEYADDEKQVSFRVYGKISSKGEVILSLFF